MGREQQLDHDLLESLYGVVNETGSWERFLAGVATRITASGVAFLFHSHANQRYELNPQFGLAPPINSQYTIDASGFLSVTPQGIAEDFAQDRSAAEQRLLTATQGPLNFSALTATIGSATWRTKPSWFVVAGKDRTISPDLERAEAQTLGAAAITLASSHVAMISHPFAVADPIEDAAKGQRDVTAEGDEDGDSPTNR